MARTKGSKNKPKVAIEGGNPDFNITQVEPTDVLSVAHSAPQPEDYDLERTLADLGRQNPMPDISDPDPVGSVVKRQVEQREMLGDVVTDYKPASTFEELRNQVHFAKSEGCDSIEATKTLAKQVCRDKLLEQVGYFMYHDIKVYLEGAFEQASKRDNQTIENRLFGASQIK